MKKLLLIIAVFLIGFASKAEAAELGYPQVGASNQGSTAVNCTSFVTSEAGTITSMSIYIGQGGNGASTGNLGLYSDVAGTMTTKLATSTNTFAVASADSWATSTVSYTFTNATTYWLCFAGKGGAPQFKYDAGAAGQNKDFTFTNNSDWPSTAPAANNSLSRKMTIRATYTPTGSATAVPPNRFRAFGAFRFLSAFIFY